MMSAGAAPAEPTPAGPCAAPNDGPGIRDGRGSWLTGESGQQDWIADESLAAILRAARERQPEAVGVAQLRLAARARAADRPPGPPMRAEDRRVRGVRVRVYQSGRPSVIVYLHGGGFVLGDLDTHDAFVRRLAAATDATVVAVDYDRAPESPWPAAVDQAVAVIEWAATRGPVAVAGDSAGGLIAVLAALRLGDRVSLTAQLLMCPNTDPTLTRPGVAEKSGGWLLDIDQLRQWISWWVPDAGVRASNATNLLVADLDGLPPALVVTAEHDPLRDEGDAYAIRLAAAGVAVVYRVEPGLVHNFPTLSHVCPAAMAAEARYLADARRLITAGAAPPAAPR